MIGFTFSKPLYLASFGVYQPKKEKQENDNTKKNSKKQRAGMLLASALKWAEMAADPENGRNSKKFFSLAYGHHVPS